MIRLQVGRISLTLTTVPLLNFHGIDEVTMYNPDLAKCVWECVHFNVRDQIVDLETEESLVGFSIIQCDVDAVTDDDVLLSLLARKFHFPDYFGHNWNALDECLRDLDSWMPAKGYILVLNGASRLWKEATFTAGRLVMSWQFCAQRWNEKGKPFHLIFVLEDS